MGFFLDDLFPHEFDENDWMEDMTKEILINDLISFRTEFGVITWTKRSIIHFLNVNFHLMRGELKDNHIRTIITIITKGEK